jgi:hypothetical protein
MHQLIALVIKILNKSVVVLCAPLTYVGTNRITVYIVQIYVAYISIYLHLYTPYVCTYSTSVHILYLYTSYIRYIGTYVTSVHIVYVYKSYICTYHLSVHIVHTLHLYISYMCTNRTSVHTVYLYTS